tara:strand:- start:46 stop:219 length:174 start_codon:yes stop_codon:yes gene_type:complete
MFSTTIAPANELINKDKSSGSFILKQRDIMANIASPAPTLSMILLAKAGQYIGLEFF